MDLITLGAALNGAKTQTESYVDSHFKAGSNITITDNVDGTQTIAASGEVSSEDTVARGEIADHVANTSNPHDVKGDQVELHTYAKATEKVAIASGDKVNEALGKLEKKIDDNVINDSTITIKKNGTIVDSFTTNASSGKEINIAVPSTAADVGALANTVKYAGSASAGGSATSAVKLDNTADSGSLTQPIFFDNGKPKATSYSLAKSVPSDAVFTDTTYESKAAVESGTDVSLVTTGEKYTWNNKQSAISTSSRLAGNAVNMTGYSKASEQAAISSGDVMTTAIGKLEKKADDNKNNILLTYNQNGKTFNIVDWSLINGEVGSDNNVTYSYADGIVTVTGTKSVADSYMTVINTLILTPNTNYVVSQIQTGSPDMRLKVFGYDTTWRQLADTGSSTTFNSGTYSKFMVRFTLAGSSTGVAVDKTIKPMLIEKSMYDAGFTDYQPYAMSNADLTPHTTNVIKNAFTATDWTKVDELAFEIPAGKTAKFIASATRDTNQKCLGIAFVRDTTFSYDNVLAIAENANNLNYFTLSCAGIRSRSGGSAETINVFVKYSGQVATSITRTYTLV